MIEARLPDCVSFDFRILPGYRTRVTELDNGYEQRNIERTKAKRRFTAAYANFSKAQFKLLLGCWHVAKAAGNAFRMRDWSDYEAEDEPLGAASVADMSPLQLTKRYDFAGLEPEDQPIYKPNSDGFTLYEGGTPKTGSVDTTTGLFTPASNWTIGAARFWVGTFDRKVRFYSDELDTVIVSRNASGLVLTTNCELIEVFGT